MELVWRWKLLFSIWTSNGSSKIGFFSVFCGVKGFTGVQYYMGTDRKEVGAGSPLPSFSEFATEVYSCYGYSTGVFPSLDSVSGTLCLLHYVTETSRLHSLRDFWRHFGLCRAAAHSDCCFFTPCTNILIYLLTYLPPILQRFRDIAVDRSEIAIPGYPSCV